MKTILGPILKISSKRAGDKTEGREAAGGKSHEGLAELTRGGFFSENDASVCFSPAQPRIFLRWVLGMMVVGVLGFTSFELFASQTAPELRLIEASPGQAQWM